MLSIMLIKDEFYRMSMIAPLMRLFRKPQLVIEMGRSLCQTLMQRQLANSTNNQGNWPYSSSGTIRSETLILVPNPLSMLLCSNEDENPNKLLKIAIETWEGQITPTLKACFPWQLRIKTRARKEGHRRLSRGHTWEAIKQVDSIWKMTIVYYLQFKINIPLMKLQ